jgi:hypothetical protein
MTQSDVNRAFGETVSLVKQPRLMQSTLALLRQQHQILG